MGAQSRDTRQARLAFLPMTIPSPLCVYQDCQRHGRCELGDQVRYDGSLNTPIRCLQCGRHGELSEAT